MYLIGMIKEIPCVSPDSRPTNLSVLGVFAGMAAVHASTMVIVSWVLDPGVRGEYKHIKLYVLW